MAKQKGENLHGILLLDKPIGISSHSALQKAKSLLNANKAGHTGSLDPLASGMLPLCFGEATKFSRFFLEADKCYQAVMRLGMTTTTGDSEGELLAVKPVPPLSTDLIANMLASFKGESTQIPPMYSALKYQGQPLYKLARKGKEVVRQARKITIFNIALEKISQQDADHTIAITVVCSKGTYIRTLIEDMGAYLGCGAHVISLRRLWSAPFQHSQMITLSELEANTVSDAQTKLIPIQAILSSMLPQITLDHSLATALLHGRTIQLPETDPTMLGWVSLATSDGEFIGVGEMQENNRVVPRRLVHSSMLNDFSLTNPVQMVAIV